MKRVKKPTLSVGIPAYNEEGNIGFILKSIFRQKQKLFKLEKVYVVCDGCDNTANIVKEISKKHKNIVLFDRKRRMGKIEGLELIYKLNTSDLILTMDADLVFEKETDIDLLVKAMVNDERLNFVGPRHIPVPAQSLMGKFAVVSYLCVEDAFLHLNDGNNFYAVLGTYLLKKSFSKTIKYPKGVHADQVLLYGFATRNNKNGFKLVKRAHVLFRTVTTFNDWRILATRSVIGDKANTVKLFGKEILKEYSLPKYLVIKSLLKYLLKSPFYTLGSILMNIYIRQFPLKRDIIKGGVWEPVKSSKEGIKLNYAK